MLEFRLQLCSILQSLPRRSMHWLQGRAFLPRRFPEVQRVDLLIFFPLNVLSKFANENILCYFSSPNFFCLHRQVRNSDRERSKVKREIENVPGWRLSRAERGRDGMGEAI